MYSDNSAGLLLQFLFYMQFLCRLTSGSTGHVGCANNECVPAKDCKEFVNFIKSHDKTLRSTLVEILREKQCGFENGYPKVCCMDSPHKPAPLDTDFKSCNVKDECILSKDCQSFVEFVDRMEKPLKPSIIKFLKSQLCGFEEGYAKVCCSNQNNMKLLKQYKLMSKPKDDKKHRKSSVTKLDSKNELNSTPTISNSKLRIKAKADIINRRFDIDDFFDFVVM